MSSKRYIQTVVYLDKELADWLHSKTEEGYSKSALIRRAIAVYKDREGTASGNAGQEAFVEGHGE